VIARLRQIRCGILMARRFYEPHRLTSWQADFLIAVDDPKSRLVGDAYMEEANRYVWRKDRAALKRYEDQR